MNKIRIATNIKYPAENLISTPVVKISEFHTFKVLDYLGIFSEAVEWLLNIRLLHGTFTSFPATGGRDGAEEAYAGLNHESAGFHLVEVFLVLRVHA